jgi:hypothetical protein
MFPVVVASLRVSVGCVSRWWSPFGRPGSQLIDGRAASIMSRPSALRVTWLKEEQWRAQRPSVVEPHCIGAGD